MSILQFLKPIDGVPGPSSQLLSLVPSAAIQGMNQKVAMLDFQVIKLNKTKSVEYPSSKVTFEVSYPSQRTCVCETLNCSMRRYTYNVAIVHSHPSLA